MRRERKFYTALAVLLFIPGAFAFWEFVYELCHMIGAVVSGDPTRAIIELKRMLPLILTAFMYAYLQAYTFGAYRASECLKRFRIWKANGVITIIMGAFITLYVVAGLVTGQYARIVEGYISPLFPLDMMIGGILFVLFGVFAIKYGEKIRSTQRVSDSAELVSYFRLFHMLSYLVASCGFAGFVYGVFTMDFMHGNLFYNVMLLLNFFTAFAMAVVYRFVFAEKSAGAERNRSRKKWSVGFLVFNIVIFVVYLASVELQSEAPNLNAFAVLPIEFTASFNAFPLVFGFNNILAPLVALIFRRKE